MRGKPSVTQYTFRSFTSNLVEKAESEMVIPYDATFELKIFSIASSDIDCKILSNNSKILDSPLENSLAIRSTRITARWPGTSEDNCATELICIYEEFAPAVLTSYHSLPIA